MADHRSPAGFLGLVAVGVGVCCGFPILVSVGVAGAIAGLSLGSWVLISAAIGVSVVELWRLVRRRSECRVLAEPSSSDSTAPDEVSHLPAVGHSKGTAPR